MASSYISIERQEHVLRCTLANPPSHTLTAGGVRDLHGLLDELEGDPSVRVVVFTGDSDDVFIRHYEVSELAERAEQNVLADTKKQPEGNTRLHAVHRLCLRLESLHAITVAAINGHAGGGGCEFSLACDFRLMKSGKFTFGLPETSVGIIPGAGGPQRYSRLLGTARAMDLILHARLLSPEQALLLGLVHRVFAAEDFEQEVKAFALDLAQRAPVALRAAKRAILAGAGMPMTEALALEQGCLDETMRSKDAAGAMRSLISGDDVRTYPWKGE